MRLPFGLEIGSNPLFFTNIFDIPQLGNEHKYIACKYLFFCKCCRQYFAYMTFKLRKWYFSLPSSFMIFRYDRKDI